jgi:hypothetical protein
MSQSYKPSKVDLDTLPNLGHRKIQNNAFKVGEQLKYTVHYGWLDAGEAILTVEESKWKFGNRDAYHIVGTGQSLGSFDWFFKVRDRYESYIDKQGLYPYRFVRNCDEGGYKIFQDYKFQPEKRAMTTHEGDTLYTPAYLQDMISAYYYARTLNFDNAKKGDIFTITTFVDGEVFPLKIKYMGKETIKLRAGKFRCMRFVPVVQEGRIFKDEEDLNVWITDDKNKIPILIKSKILVGSIKMEVTEWSGLANPIAIVED